MNAPTDLIALKTRQRAAWDTGDYAVIGTTLQIVGELLAHGTDPVLLTRANDEQVGRAVADHGAAIRSGGCALWRAPSTRRAADLLVISPGTPDQPVVAAGPPPVPAPGCGRRPSLPGASCAIECGTEPAWAGWHRTT